MLLFQLFILFYSPKMCDEPKDYEQTSKLKEKLLTWQSRSAILALEE